MTGLSLRAGRLAAAAFAAGAVAFAVVPAAPATSAPTGLAAATPAPYFAAGFSASRNAVTFGQGPAWTPAGNVLSQERDRHGVLQIFVSGLDGRHRRCLTCGRLRGPNGFPQARPQGDWILFCSLGAQPAHFGSPCLGGYGSDLYVMRPDGSEVTRLTAASDPAGGVPYDQPERVAYDNYHPYWSPDGRHLIWTRTEAYPLAQGGQRWEMLLGDFVVPRRGRPFLHNIRVVGPAFGVYETQAWAPDGSGFLFTAFGPRRSPFQSEPPGWMHLELYYMCLFGRSCSPAHPRVVHLSDDDPAYEEQAVFTPDMREVIVMTNRARPASWYEMVMAAAQWSAFDAPDAGSAGTPMFLADFSDPQFTSDLYMIDVATGAVRRLTDFGHVVPEFAWDRGYSRLLWTENLRSGRQITRVARFYGVPVADRRPPRAVPRNLIGQPVDMARVGGATPPPRGGLAGAATSWQAVTGSYLALLERQLGALAAVSGAGIARPPL